MTCRICHTREGEGTCPECRELADDLRLNAEVLATLREELLPPVVLAPVRRLWPMALKTWKTGVAAAALIAILFPVLHHRPPAPVVTAPRPRAAGRQLKVKLLTPDPDVVIYWLIEQKEDVAK